MAWIKYHGGLERHPMTRRLARQLGVSVPSAVGLIILLWHYCAKYGKDGDLSGIENKDIANGMEWSGDADLLIESLIATEYLTESRVIPNWHIIRPYPPEMPMREAWKVIYRVATEDIFRRDGAICALCGATENLSIDHIKPIAKGGTNDYENLQVLCRSCNSRKKDRYELLD